MAALDRGQEFLRQLPAAPRARRNVCDDATNAEPLFWSGVQSIAGIFGNGKRAKGILVQPSGKDLAILCQLAERGQAQAHSEPDILPLSRGGGA